MNAALTSADVISTLMRSSMPTVLTEGSDDYRVMRRIESKLSDIGIDFLPVGGKRKVLDAWNGLSSDRKKTVLPMVDLDLWVFSGIPADLHSHDFIYTIGYSIENDIFIDANLLNMCDAQERAEFVIELEHIAAWYAYEIQKALRGQPFEVNRHPTEILGLPNMIGDLDDQGRELRLIIIGNYIQLLRGKILIQLLSRQLNKIGRSVKFSYKQLYEIASFVSGPLLSNVENRIRFHFK